MDVEQDAGHDRRAILEARVEAEAQRFDLRPLLGVLGELGYCRDDVLFEGAMSGRSASVVEAVRFVKRPVRGVIVTVHLGLLGDNGLLPSYFFHVAEKSLDAVRFFDFIRFFDHHLIYNLFAALHPEVEDGSLGDFDTLLQALLRIVAPGSPSTLHHIVQLIYPEYRVRVRRYPFGRLDANRACCTGDIMDGSAVLGRAHVQSINGYLVELFAQEERDASGPGHAALVRSRIEKQLLPLLKPFALGLLIRLIVQWHSTFARVDHSENGGHDYFGYGRLRDNHEAIHGTVLFRGMTNEPLPGSTTPKTEVTAISGMADSEITRR